MSFGKEIITEYTSDSSYVSSTPLPSLTLSKKIELERYLHDGVVVSKFSESNIVVPEEDKPDEVNKESVTEQEQERIPKERKQSSLEELRSESLSRLDDEEQKQNQIVGSSLARLDSPLEKNGCCLLL